MQDVRKFDIAGREYRVLSEAGAGYFVVEQVMEDEDGGEVLTQAMVLQASMLFDKPPVEKVHAEIAQAEAKLAAVRKEHSLLVGEMAKTRTKDAVDRAKRLEALECALDLLDGKLAWAVRHTKRGEVSVIDLAEHKGKKGQWRIFLCQTTSDTGDAMEWYSERDHGNGWDDRAAVIPCATKEQATQKAVEVLRSMERNHEYQWWIDALAASAERFGVELSPSVLADWRKSKERQLRENLKRDKDMADTYADKVNLREAELAKFLAK